MVEVAGTALLPTRAIAEAVMAHLAGSGTHFTKRPASDDRGRPLSAGQWALVEERGPGLPGLKLEANSEQEASQITELLHERALGLGGSIVSLKVSTLTSDAGRGRRAVNTARPARR